MSRNSKNSYSHILKYTGLFGGIQFLNLLIALVRNKFVALILGPLGMGLISLFNSTINLVSNTTNLGISMSAVKNIAESYESKNQSDILNTISMIRSWSIITATLMEYNHGVGRNHIMYYSKSSPQCIHFHMGRSYTTFHMPIPHCRAFGHHGRRNCYFKRDRPSECSCKDIHHKCNYCPHNISSYILYIRRIRYNSVAHHNFTCSDAADHTHLIQVVSSEYIHEKRNLTTRLLHGTPRLGIRCRRNIRQWC